MSQLAWITPVDTANTPGFGGGIATRPSPAPPIVIPPLPPGTPEHPIALPPSGEVPANPIVIPGTPEHPIALPPSGEVPANPIVIPGTPEHPIALPPGQVWPPLNPSDGIYGEALVLIWVVGTDKYRWVSLDRPAVWPPAPQPK